MKEFFNKSTQPPYLSNYGASSPNAVIKDSVSAKEKPSSNEADAAAGGSMLQKVSSFGLLGSAAKSKKTSQEQLAQQQQKSDLAKAQSPRNSFSNLQMSFGFDKEHAGDHDVVPSWRLKDRMKTVGVGLVMALNVGTDPPDVTKPHPCAKLQCWMDPTSVSRAKAKEKIVERLEAQYAKWQQQRAAKPLKYKRAPDPTVEDVRALCIQLRRQARGERVLLHYNGHGVPRPTSNGEIWVFDKGHTQYIPLSITDLRQWLGKPSIVVLDCSSAGVLMPFFTMPLEPPVQTPSPINAQQKMPGTADDIAAAELVRDTIVLCPTSDQEWLPMADCYPADIFTSCLTTPIQMALRWFVRRNPQSKLGGLSPEAIDMIPGRANDRKTPLGELNWIFTAVTDSIAWNVLPKPLFSRLFRQDLLVASLFRNFLLADRILRSLNCTPQSYPPLPPGVCDHPLWQAWDLACETCLNGLIRDGSLSNHMTTHPGGETVPPIANESTANITPSMPSAPPKGSSTSQQTPLVNPSTSPNVASPFFSEQLTAFEIWLEFASMRKDVPGGAYADAIEPYESPEQLPVVLQVLLSQAHRVRALVLLRRFLDLGPWAVNLALSLGIFPYVMKLLQSPEYKHVLLGIWAKILAFDPSCQVDLVKDGALQHFIFEISLSSPKPNVNAPAANSNSSARGTLAAFILSVTCLGYLQGQADCFSQNLHGSCCALLSSIEFGDNPELDPNYATNKVIAESNLPPAFRMWLCICLGNLVKSNYSAQSEAYRAGVHHRLFARLQDDCPSVRASACYALGCLVGATTSSPSVQQQHGLLPPQLLAGQAASNQLQPTPALSWHAQQQLREGVMHPQPIPGGQSIPVQPTPYNPTLLAPQHSQVPSVFEDRSRLDLDLSVMGALVKSTEDASSLVRYEATMSLACAVEKYLPAFAAVAEEIASSPSSTVRPPGETSHLQRQSNVVNDTSLVPFPPGVDRLTAEKFSSVWLALRLLQHKDLFPAISLEANTVVSVVHEHMLRSKMERVVEDRQDKGGSMISTGVRHSISETVGTVPMESPNSVSLSGRMNHLLDVNGQSDDFVSVATPPSGAEAAGLRRIASEFITGVDAGAPHSQAWDQIDYVLPKSKFYDWKKGEFSKKASDMIEEKDNIIDIDPLSPEGAMQSYRERRNMKCHERSTAMSDRYAGLSPSPMKRSNDVDLFFDDTTEKEQESASKKKELELRQTALLVNDGVEMTSMLKFHGYEDVLVVADNTDGISLWNTENSTRECTFKNCNQKGSRITSATWINEMTSSLFLVGSDDGSVRIWDGLLASNGKISMTQPSLASAFFAAPDLVPGARGSGLITEWQQYSGKLIASGNSKWIHCWDLGTEQCITKLETSDSKSCITTLTTAWQPGQGSAAENNRGIGPDIVVAGCSDGCMRVFDIRTKSQVAADVRTKEETRRTSPRRSQRRGRTTNYAEHKSWIVDTSFTSFGGRYEIVSGSVTGEVKVWDLRLSTSIKTLEVQRSPLTALSTHSKIPMIASGSHAQFIKILTLDGDTLQVIRYHENKKNYALNGHRIGPVSCLEFHPNKNVLAAGATDEIVSIYSPKVATT